MEQMTEPTPELKQFMKQGTLELYNIIMKFIDEKVDQLPDEPKIIHTATASMVSASTAFYLAYKYSDMEKEKMMEGALFFCDAVMRNLEALIDRPDFNFIMGKEE